MLSLQLATLTVLVITPMAVFVARYLACYHSSLSRLIEAFIVLPLVLPPTVLGYYLLIGFGNTGAIGELYTSIFDAPLAFTFNSLLFASLIFNLPFAIQPAQRAFESIDQEVRESAWCCGLSVMRTFFRIELPLAWNGILSGMLLTFAHTLGEFGVVLMVGGNIPGETRTVSIAIFDRVEAFDDRGAAIMSSSLLLFSLLIIGSVFMLNNYRRVRNAN